MLSPDLVVKGVFDVRSFLASVVAVPSYLMFIRKSIILSGQLSLSLSLSL
jgi:hypothetical protein